MYCCYSYLLHLSNSFTGECMLKMRENWFILNEQSVSLSLILQCPVEENYKEMVHKLFSFLPEASIHRLFFKLSYGYILFVTCTTLVYIYQSLDKWNIKTLLDLCTRSFICTMMTWSNNPYVKHLLFHLLVFCALNICQ